MAPRLVLPEGLEALYVPLEYSSGFVGGPIPPDMAGSGCPVLENACLGSTRKSLRTAPGWVRTTTSRVRSTATYALDNTKKWVAYDGEINGVHGTYFTLLDWTNASPVARTLSSGFNRDIPPSLVKGGWDPSSLTYFVVSEYGGQGVYVGRMTPHEYPTPPVTFRQRTYFYDKYTVPCTLTPGAFRESIPNAPQRKPVLRAAATSLDCDILHDTATALTAVSGNATVAQNNTAPRWSTSSAAGYNYNTITVTTDDADANLAYGSKFFSFVEARKPRSPRVNDDDSGYGVERGRYAYRTAFYVTCYEPPAMTTGSGLNDIRVTGSSTSITDSTIEIEVSSAGPTDQFRFRVDGGAWSAAADMQDDKYITLGSTGLKVRWLATTGHTATNVWTIETEYVGTADAGFPSRVTTAGNPDTYPSSPFDVSVNVTKIAKGSNQIGIGGRKVYRTCTGPFDLLKPERVLVSTGGQVPVGAHKYVYSYVYPELGESPCSTIPDNAVENKNYPASMVLTSLRAAPTMAKMFDSSNVKKSFDNSENDLTVSGKWGGASSDDGMLDEDWEIKIVVTGRGTGGGGKDQYDTYVNGVKTNAAAIDMSGSANPVNFSAASGGASTGVSLEWVDFTSNHTVGDYWIINRSLNNVTRRVYRSDDIEKNTYYLVGEQDHLQDTFVDDKSREEFGPERPHIQELPFYQVLQLENTTAISDVDITRNYNMGDELSKIPDAVDHTRVRFPFRLKDLTTDPGRVLQPNSISFFVSGNSVPTESVKEVPIDIPIQAGPWYYLDLPWKHGYFEAYSYGFRQIQRDRDSSVSAPPIIQVGTITVDRGKWGPFTGKWASRFTYVSEESKTETDSSQPSTFIDLDDKATGLELDIPGYRGFWDTAANSYADDPVGINTPPVNLAGTITHPLLNIYLFKESWGNDPSGGGEYHLAVKEAKNPVPTSATPGDYFTYPILIGNKDSKFLGTTNSYSIGPSTPGETVSEDKATSQSLRKPGDRQLMTEQGGILGRTREDNAAIAIEELRAANPLHDYRGRGPATSAAILDYDRIVSGPESDFAVDSTTFTFTQYKDVAKFNRGATIARLYPWMEGRRFTINSDDKNYSESSTGANDGLYTTTQRTFVIQKVINPNTPTNTWIVFGSDYNGQTLEFNEAYYGSTGNKAYRIRGNKSSFRYSTNTTLLSSDPDYWALQNEVPIGFVNDEYQTPAHAGEYLILMGKSSVFRTLLDRTVTDDQGPIAYPKPELIHGMPGTIAPRSVVSLPDGRIAWWTPDNRLAMGDASGFSYYEGPDPDLPMSERYKGWLETNCDPEFIQFAHAYFDPVRQWYVIHFIATGAGDCPEEGTEYITTAPAADFTHKLVIDLRYGICWTGTLSKMTHSLYLPADCVTTGQSGGKIITGDIYGFMHDYGYSSFVSAGVPAAQTLIEYTVSSILGAVITLTTSTLVTTGDGIANASVLISTSTGVETAVVSSNTAGTITLTAAPSTTPVAGDKVYVGGIKPDIHFLERHFVSPVQMTGMFVDTYDPTGSTAMELTLKYYTASGNGLHCVTTTPRVSRTLTMAQLQTEWYAGMRRLPSKAIRPGLTYIQKEGSPTTFGRIMGQFRASETETGRNFQW